MYLELLPIDISEIENASILGFFYLEPRPEANDCPCFDALDSNLTKKGP
jgi:hypothetical protein